MKTTVTMYQNALAPSFKKNQCQREKLFHKTKTSLSVLSLKGADFFGVQAGKVIFRTLLDHKLFTE